MKILVIGSGGREHALLWALRRNATQPLDLFCAPGNAGIAEIGKCLPLDVDDIPALASFSETERIDLNVVGPEGPLAAGIVDEFEKRGLNVVGPGREAARLESSKAFAKDFMRRHAIPTARYRIASSANEAFRILQTGEFGGESAPLVVKADGLAAGKGVIVAGSRLEATKAIEYLLGGTISADATHRIIIEEALAGREVSLLLFSDGKDFRLMPASRDHKRVGENDTGPNTGGMGSITEAAILDDAMRERIVREVVEPTLQGARDEGFPFRGILFVGLMLTSDGPRVLEYNVRFGDPETQAIMMRLKSDPAMIFQAISETRLGELEIDWSDQPSSCVVLAGRGYPAKPEIGSVINGLDLVERDENVAVFHAATSRGPHGEWLTAGGRVLGVTAKGETLDLALSRCYGAIANIHWDGMHYRRDIGRPVRA
ncbi:MAG: phosphoribosylamine---glycine ligase [Blastocatellia bacterium]|jgi:phosphoribosylamine--glycine ligase|nr:phosphoribosylamine---glycine ligase [Blastocatellia bacterium]